MKSLITGHLKNISSKIFDSCYPEITRLVGKRYSVNALQNLAILKSFNLVIV